MDGELNVHLGLQGLQGEGLWPVYIGQNWDNGGSISSQYEFCSLTHWWLVNIGSGNCLLPSFIQWLAAKQATSHYKKYFNNFPDSKVHGANMGPIWGRQDPGGPHVGPMNFAIWVSTKLHYLECICNGDTKWKSIVGSHRINWCRQCPLNLCKYQGLFYRNHE